MLAQHDSICRTAFLQFKQNFPCIKTRDTTLPKKWEEKTNPKPHKLSQKSFDSPLSLKKKKEINQLTKNSRQKK